MFEERRVAADVSEENVARHTSPLDMRKVSTRYIEWMFCNPAADLLRSKVYPDAKEWTEAMACYEAVHKYITPLPAFAFDNPNVSMIAIGDGSTPRVGAMFATRSAWRCISVDPNMKWRNVNPRFDRLTAIRASVEDLVVDLPPQGALVLVACHSHADLNAAVTRLGKPYGRERLAVVSMPCCIPQEIDDWPPAKVYDDWACWSEHRRISVWHN